MANPTKPIEESTSKYFTKLLELNREKNKQPEQPSIPVVPDNIVPEIQNNSLSDGERIENTNPVDVNFLNVKKDEKVVEEIKPDANPSLTGVDVSVVENKDTNNNNTDVKKEVDPEKLFLYGYGLAILATTFTSAFHLIDFFLISYSLPLAIVLATAIEIVVIAIVIGAGVLNKIKAGYVYSILGIILAIQFIGNSFSAYHNYTEVPKLLADTVSFFTFGSYTITKFTISCIEGGFLPTVSFLLMKSVTSYFDPENIKKYTRRR